MENISPFLTRICRDRARIFQEDSESSLAAVGPRTILRVSMEGEILKTAFPSRNLTPKIAVRIADILVAVTAPLFPHLHFARDVA